LANIETSTLDYYAATPAVLITSALTVSSPDTTTLAGATVAISSGLIASEDSLGFTNQNGITGSYNSATGVLTLVGTSSIANYQAALRSVSYIDSNALTTTAPRTISFQVNDGLATNSLSNVVSRTISVQANPPPTCSSVSAVTDKNTAIAINVLSNCSDVDPDDTLTVGSVVGLTNLGSVSINTNGTIEYNPAGAFQSLTQGQSATCEVIVRVSNGYEVSLAEVNVTIDGVNDPPVISNVETTPLSYQSGTAPVAITSALTLSDDDDTMIGSATVSVTSGFSSAEDTLSFTNTTNITGSYNSSTGVLALSGPDTIANYQAALQSVEFSTNDSSAAPAARTVSFQVTDSLGATSNTESRTIDVTEGDIPSCVAQPESTLEGTKVTFNVLTGASDPDGSKLTVVSVGAPGDVVAVALQGGATVPGTDGSILTVDADGAAIYSPGTGFVGEDVFDYTVSNGHLSCSSTITVTVSSPPVISYVGTTISYQSGTAPVSIAPDLTLIAEDSTISSATISITSGFLGGEDTLSFTNQNGITGSYNSSTGVLALSGNASIDDYQTALQSVAFSTSDTSASPALRIVSFQVTDSNGATSNTASVTIDLTAAA